MTGKIQLKVMADLLRDRTVNEGKLFAILAVASNPPKWAQTEADRWADVVIRGRHISYGGAIAHFHASLAKHA